MTVVPGVSVIVPVHDGARYLGECLESIRTQTVPPLEVLVIDDGSSDGSGDIARGFGGSVRCLRQPHGGPSRARNIGVGEARGELVAFVDADDLLVPHKLERQLARFAARPELALSDAWARNFWSPEIPVEARKVAPREAFTHGTAPKPRLIITWVVRRVLFDRFGGFDESRRLGEDDEWRDRLDAADVSTETLDEVLALRRLHADNVTRRRYDEYLSQVVRRARNQMARARTLRTRADDAS